MLDFLKKIKDLDIKLREEYWEKMSPDYKIAEALSEVIPYSSEDIFELFKRCRSWDEVQCYLDYCSINGNSDIFSMLDEYGRSENAAMFRRGWYSHRFEK